MLGSANKLRLCDNPQGRWSWLQLARWAGLNRASGCYIKCTHWLRYEITVVTLVRTHTHAWNSDIAQHAHQPGPPRNHDAEYTDPCVRG